MKDKLEALIRANVLNPREEEVAEIQAVFHLQEFSKGAFFKEPFTISKNVGFIVEGEIRAIFFKEDGEEATANLMPENSLLSDLVSVRLQKPTPLGLKCVEDTTILVASQENIQQLLQTNLALNIVVREYMADRMVDVARKQLLFMTGTAKERYEFILRQNPKLLKKAPLRWIASMIGITPTQLSRIRKEARDAKS